MKCNQVLHTVQITHNLNGPCVPHRYLMRVTQSTHAWGTRVTHTQQT